jgi:hypothetical protein
MNFEGLDVDIGERQTLINEGLLIPNRVNSSSRHPINDLTYHQPFHNKPIPNLLEEYRRHKKRNGLILTGISLCFLLLALAFFIPLVLELYLEGYKSPTNPFANITLDFTITGAVIGGFDLIFIIGILFYFLREKKRKEMEGEENSLIEMSRGDYIAIWKIQVEDEGKGHSQWKNYVDHIYGVDGWPFKAFSIQSYAKYFILYIIISALIFGLFSLRLILSGNIWLFPEDRNLFNYIVAAVISLFLTFIIMISSFSIFVGYTKYRYYTSLNIKPSVEFIISLHGVYCRELYKITIWKPILLDNIMSSKYEYKINSMY